MKDKAQVELTFRLPIDLCCKSDDSCCKPNEPSTGGGSGIEEAPKDGKIYARQNGNWIAIERDDQGSTDIPSVISNSYVGEIFWYSKTTPPPNAFYCDGRAISRDEYTELFAVIGTSFGEGDGSATFNLPDMRGEFVRGYDPANIRYPQGSTREFGKHQDGTQIPYVFKTPGENIHIGGSSGTANYPDYYDKLVQVGPVVSHRYANTTSANDTISTYYTPRSTNINLLPCIRFK